MSKEYLRGRRASYLDPIRMYIFTSAIFFVIFFSFEQSGEIFNKNSDVPDINKEQALTEMKKELKTQENPTARKVLQAEIADLEKSEKPKVSAAVGMPADNGIITVNVGKDTDIDKTDEDISIFGGKLPPRIAEYDSMQAKRPVNKRDGWLKRNVKRRIITIHEEYHNNKKEFLKNLSDNFKDTYPQIMFVSLPLAALILQLLYVRRRKQFFYVSHGIFILHVYIAVYILLLLYYLSSALHNVSHWKIFAVLDLFFILSIFLYIYKAMRNFYGQGRIKTLLKLFIFSFIYFIVFVLLVSTFLFISLMQV